MTIARLFAVTVLDVAPPYKPVRAHPAPFWHMIKANVPTTWGIPKVVLLTGEDVCQ